MPGPGQGRSLLPPVPVSVRWRLTIRLSGPLTISDQRKIYAWTTVRGGITTRAPHGEEDVWTLRIPSNAPTAALALEVVAKMLATEIPADRIDNLLVHSIRRIIE